MVYCTCTYKDDGVYKHYKPTSIRFGAWGTHYCTSMCSILGFWRGHLASQDPGLHGDLSGKARRSLLNDVRLTQQCSWRIRNASGRKTGWPQRFVTGTSWDILGHLGHRTETTTQIKSTEYSNDLTWHSTLWIQALPEDVFGAWFREAPSQEVFGHRLCPY